MKRCVRAKPVHSCSPDVRRVFGDKSSIIHFSDWIGMVEHEQGFWVWRGIEKTGSERPVLRNTCWRSPSRSKRNEPTVSQRQLPVQFFRRIRQLRRMRQNSRGVRCRRSLKAGRPGKRALLWIRASARPIGRLADFFAGQTAPPVRNIRSFWLRRAHPSIASKTSNNFASKYSG